MIHSDESTSILHELCPIQPDTVYHEDCLEGMKRIPDGSVDLILCDLPYGTTQYRWDSVIPTDLLFSEYRRILKPNGTFLLFGSEPFSTVLRMQDLKLYKYDWVWEKDNVTGFADAKNKPMKRHELISVFSKGSTGHKGIVPEGRRMTYNPQGLVSLGDTETGWGKKPTTAVLDGVEYSHRSGKICKTGRFPNGPAECGIKKNPHGRLFRRGVYSAILRGQRTVSAIHQTQPNIGQECSERKLFPNGGGYGRRLSGHLSQQANHLPAGIHQLSYFYSSLCQRQVQQTPLAETPCAA